MTADNYLSIMSWTKKLNYEQAKDKALRLLTFRAHSEKELSDKLLRAGAEEEDIERILSFCREYKFVDDRQYAIRKAKDLLHLKKFGKRRIISELYAKGVSSELIDEAISELEFDEDELLGLVRKKLGGNFEQKSVDRCIRYFLYRGYDIYEIQRHIETAKGEADEL